MAAGNKENVNPTNQNKGSSMGQDKGVALQGERLKSSNRGGSKKNNGKALEVRGPRPRRDIPSQPTRGLVFGPIGGEVERSSNGKRQRVEKVGLGCSGGSVARAGDGSCGTSGSGDQETEVDEAMRVDGRYGSADLARGLASLPPESESALQSLGEQ